MFAIIIQDQYCFLSFWRKSQFPSSDCTSVERNLYICHYRSAAVLLSFQIYLRLHISNETETQWLCYSRTAGQEGYHSITHEWLNTKQPSTCIIALVPSSFSVCYGWFLYIGLINDELILFLVTKNTYTIYVHFQTNKDVSRYLNYPLLICWYIYVLYCWTRCILQYSHMVHNVETRQFKCLMCWDEDALKSVFQNSFTVGQGEAVNLGKKNDRV